MDFIPLAIWQHRMILNRETIWSDLCLTKSSHAMEDGLDGETLETGRDH